MTNVLMLLPLTLLTACSSKPLTVVKQEPILPPKMLLNTCLEPQYNGQTWADILEHAIDLKEALAKCNIDKKALQDWYESNKESNND